MNCAEFRKILPEFSEDGQGPDLLRSFAEHRDRCPACGALWKRQEAMLAAYRSLEVPPIPQPLGPAVRRRLEAEQGRALRRPAAFSLLAAAAVLVITAGTWVALKVRTERPSPSGQPSAPRVVTAGVPEEPDVRVAKGPDGLHVTWSGGEQGAYRVLRSDRPDAWEQASEVVVADRQWTDPSLVTGSRVTFYRVEAIQRSVH